MYILETLGLKKSFTVPRTRKKVEAVKGIDLQVGEGEIFGFLGPNGAGKTTTQRILTTLVPPDAGRATVAGFDLIREPAQVRKHIGSVSQAGGTDGGATGRENLLLQARLYGMSKQQAQQRTIELIKDLALGDFADRVVYSYSGGQRRRLVLGMGLVHRPNLLFLDEPSSGLDPQSRAMLWQEVRKVRKAGTTVFLTTHYLEEADALCDHLAIIDAGIIVADGSPEQLKKEIAGDLITLILLQHEQVVAQAQDMLRAQSFVRDIRQAEKTLQVYVEQGEENLASILQMLSAANLGVQSVALARPSLDDVFLRQTGRAFQSPKNEYAAYAHN